MNRLEYEYVEYPLDYYRWKIVFDSGFTIKGKSPSVQRVYKDAAKMFKRHKKMEDLLNG